MNEEYKLWKKLEILLLKDTIAGKSINKMLDKAYLPAGDNAAFRG